MLGWQTLLELLLLHEQFLFTAGTYVTARHSFLPRNTFQAFKRVVKCIYALPPLEWARQCCDLYLLSDITPRKEGVVFS